MAIMPTYKKVVEEFFSAIAPLRAAYSDATFSYLAVSTPAGFLLLKGQLTFNVAPSKVPLTHFASASVRAGHCLLSELATSPEGLLEIIESGKITIAKEELLFPPASNGSHSAYFQPFHQVGLQTLNRVDVLGVVGAQNSELNRTLQLDWEVRAAATPYDGLQELAAEYQIGIVRTDAISIEFLANNVAAFDLGSTINGTKARLGLRLAKEGKAEFASLGYRVISQGKTVARSSIPGELFQWSESPDFRQGWAEIEVPPAAVIHGIARYAGIAQHQGWAIDPNAVQNPLRAAYETFDKGLMFLQEVLGREGRSGNARDLETVVGWVLWMLGFSVANLGSTPKTKKRLICSLRRLQVIW